MTNCLRAGGCARSNYSFLTQKERDNETGLDYFLARFYSATQGRFTSPDEFVGGPDELYYFAQDAAENPTFYAELANPQSLNKYQYCLNNPLRYIDPDGHKQQDGKSSNIVDRIIKSANEILGSLFASLQRAAGNLLESSINEANTPELHATLVKHETMRTDLLGLLSLLLIDRSNRSWRMEPDAM